MQSLKKTTVSIKSPKSISTNIDYTKSFVFVDLSYYIFYRWFALINWYKLSQKKELDVENILDDEIFMEKFEKLFWTTIEKFIKKHNLKDPNIIFAKDCLRANIWRNQFHDTYKEGRLPLKKFNGRIFTYTYKNILPKLEKEYNVKILSTDGAEADDIIAVLKNKLRSKYQTLDIYIITNDNDYLQLFDDHTYILNLKGFDLKKRSKGTPKIDLYLKIIKGDISDNIYSIFEKKNVSENFAMKYVLNENDLTTLLSENEDAKKKFDNNQHLIDFNYIPEDIKQNIEKLLV